MFNNNDTCPICNVGYLIKQTIIETFEYKKYKFKIPNYIIYYCNICNEAIVDKETLSSASIIIKNVIITMEKNEKT